MKTLILILVLFLQIVVFAPSICMAEDVVLPAPTDVMRKAIIARVEIDQINDSRIHYTIRWRDGTGEIISQPFTLQGADYDAVMKSNIVLGNVGSGIGGVLRNRILLKIKAVHGF